MEYLWLTLAFIVWMIVVPVIVYCGATALGNALRAIEKYFDND